MKNARKQILIQPNFQLKFSFLITLTVCVISGLFPFFFLSMFNIAQSHPALAENPSLVGAVANAKRDFLWTTFGIQIVLMVGVFVLSIFHSHRIVGPLYKLRISMVALRQGLLDRHIQFRKNDNFPELAKEFNAMTDAVLGRRRKDQEAVQSVLPKLDRLYQNLDGEAKASVGEVLNVLREIGESKNN